MTEPTPAPPAGQSIFISYSSSDRQRVNGLGLLLEALGHKVFLDHKTILPGRDWKASLQDGLEKAEVMLVFWTKHSAVSDWVRKEYEYIFANHPERIVVPVIGDETPLSELLKSRQHSDFFPLVNELLEMKRSMEKAGVKPPEIQKAVIERLQEAGIELDDKQQKKLLKLFLPTGFLGLISTPLALLQWGTSTGLEAIAQFSVAQLTIVGIAAISGAVFCGVVDHMSTSDQPVEANTNTQPKEVRKVTSDNNSDSDSEDNNSAIPTGTNTTTRSEPQEHDGDGSNDCAIINCDCDSVTGHLLASSWRQTCQRYEDDLKKNCAETGKIKGTCSNVSGPNAKPNFNQ